jgi:hypothetical protein
MAQRMKRIVSNLFYASIHAVCRKTLEEVNRDSVQSPAPPKDSVKNYMSSEQITQEAAATTQTRKR